MIQQLKREDLRVFFKSTFENAGYSPVRVQKFCKTAERLYEYMVNTQKAIYTPDIGLAFVQVEWSSCESGFSTLKTDRRAIEVLNTVMAGNPIKFRRTTTVHHYPGEMGEEVRKFLSYLKTEVRSAQSSLDRYAFVLSPFSIYCQLKGITLQNINYSGIVGYMASMQNADSKTSSVLRIFFRHLYQVNLLKKDYSLEIMNIAPRRREKIPSFYGKDEILRIESCIRRTTPIGKRDYAIVKLASRLGLRASDIASLEFSNIDWERNLIILKQRKTGKFIELPLLAEVGNAIIDYIKNGRPKDDSKTVFLSYSCPHRPLKGASISDIVSKKITDAGIDINGRRHGSHSLRHSLAYNMLGEGSALGTISTALGHTSVSSTMVYLGVDIGKLMDCSLAIPQVDELFYNQMGGLLYD